MRFERTGREEIYRGQMIDLFRATFRHADDGEEVTREVVEHPGAVGMLAHDGERLYLVEQPREAAGEEALLEIPAGKLDSGQDVLETAKRELAEEIGKAARHWQYLTSFYTTPGFSDEEIHVYVATGLSDAHAEAEENERIEIRTFPLDELDEVIRSCRDAKSLIALLWFRAYGGWREPPAA